MPALRTAQPFSVRLHHRQKNLSTGPDTELVERLTRIEHHAQQGQRHVDRDRLRAAGLVSTPVTTASVCFAMVASPSVGWHPCPTTGQVKESPPFSDQVQQPMGHPRSGRLGLNRIGAWHVQIPQHEDTNDVLMEALSPVPNFASISL